jgi:large subunit ribosomal protein L23
MGIFDKFKTKKEEEAVAKPQPAKKSEKKPVKKETAAPAKPAAIEPVETAAKAEAKKEIKGKSNQTQRVLIKPLITEKAAHLAAQNKYVFAVNPRMNKIEIKKAVRTVYNVEPVNVNVANFSGKNVRYGRTFGQTRGWKKAIVTLKAGDKIEIYEGV